MSANKIFEEKASFLRKKTMQNQDTNHLFSQEKFNAEIQSIQHGRAEQGQRLERCREVSWVYLVFFVFSFCSPWQRRMAWAYKAVIWNQNWWHLSPLRHQKNLLNKLKITKEVLNSQSRDTCMFVCTKLQLHLIQWLRLNVTSARLILTKKALFQTPNKATTKNMNFGSAQHWYRNEPIVSLVSSFAPSLRSGVNDATLATNKLYALQKSCNCPITASCSTLKVKRDKKQLLRAFTAFTWK